MPTKVKLIANTKKCLREGNIVRVAMHLLGLRGIIKQNSLSRVFASNERAVSSFKRQQSSLSLCFRTMIRAAYTSKPLFLLEL
jgi:hypothetical protein